jgi:Putative beta-lactamase-inhibitor-like, PepSY-like
MSSVSVLSTVALCLAASSGLIAQHLPEAKVPSAVRSALAVKYPDAKGVGWEKEKGNFEANWGSASKEDNSVLFTPDGQFLEMVAAIPVTSLPPAVLSYLKEHYPASKVTEAGKISWPAGKTGYEAEVKGKDLVFDEKGIFIKID